MRPSLEGVSLAGGVQFNCILFHSTDPMAQFCIGHIRGSVAHCGTRRGYCPEPCRLPIGLGNERKAPTFWEA